MPEKSFGLGLWKEMSSTFDKCQFAGRQACVNPFDDMLGDDAIIRSADYQRRPGQTCEIFCAVMSKDCFDTPARHVRIQGHGFVPRNEVFRVGTQQMAEDCV